MIHLTLKYNVLPFKSKSFLHAFIIHNPDSLYVFWNYFQTIPWLATNGSYLQVRSTPNRYFGTNTFVCYLTKLYAIRGSNERAAVAKEGS